MIPTIKNEQAQYVVADLHFQVSPAVVAVGRLVYFLPLGHIQFLALLIGPTYLLRSVQTPNQVRKQFFPVCGDFGYVEFFIDSEVELQKHWFV
jgi:hypothetical protein